MNRLKKFSIHLAVAFLLAIPILVQGASGNVDVKIPNPLDPAIGSDLISVIKALLNNVVMPIAAVAVVIWIIWAGFTFLTAQGKPAEIEKAKQRLLWSLIGAGILLGAAGISAVVQSTIKELVK